MSPSKMRTLELALSSERRRLTDILNELLYEDEIPDEDAVERIQDRIRETDLSLSKLRLELYRGSEATYVYSE